MKHTVLRRALPSTFRSQMQRFSRDAGLSSVQFHDDGPKAFRMSANKAECAILRLAMEALDSGAADARKVFGDLIGASTVTSLACDRLAELARGHWPNSDGFLRMQAEIVAAELAYATQVQAAQTARTTAPKRTRAKVNSNITTRPNTSPACVA